MAEPSRPWYRVLWRGVRRPLAWFVGLYVGFCVVLLALENWFLFQGVKAATAWVAPPAGLPVEDVELSSADGSTIHAWWVAPEGWTPERGAIHYSHGNYGNLSQRGGTLAVYRQLGYAVLIYDYPGYGKSNGSPSEAGLYAAGEAAYRWLTDVKGVPGERVLIYGGSLGGAVATDLASKHPCRALILASAFTSFPDLAQFKYPFLPARWFVRNQMNNRAKLASVRCPVFLTHGTIDRVVPYSMAGQLFAAASEPKYLLTVPDRGHNDAIGMEFFRELQTFLDRHAPLP